MDRPQLAKEEEEGQSRLFDPGVVSLSGGALFVVVALIMLYMHVKHRYSHSEKTNKFTPTTTTEVLHNINTVFEYLRNTYVC